MNNVITFAFMRWQFANLGSSFVAATAVLTPKRRRIRLASAAMPWQRLSDHDICSGDKFRNWRARDTSMLPFDTVAVAGSFAPLLFHKPAQALRE